MIKNMNDFAVQVNLIVEKLNSTDFSQDAKNLENTLLISNSTLEILGEVRKQLDILEKQKILKKLDCNLTVKNLRVFISKYWPGY